jgi:hypothetical protein
MFNNQTIIYDTNAHLFLSFLCMNCENFKKSGLKMKIHVLKIAGKRKYDGLSIVRNKVTRKTHMEICVGLTIILT